MTPPASENETAPDGPQNTTDQPPCADQVDDASVSPAPPRQPQFPGFGQAVLLVLAVLGLQVALGLGLALGSIVVATARGEAAGAAHVIDRPAVIAVINLLAFGAPLAFGVWWQKARARDVLPLGPPRIGLLAPIVLTVLGLAILGSDLDNLLRRVFPLPGWLARFFDALSSARTHPIESVLLLVLVAPLTDELFFRGLILRGFLARYAVRPAVLGSAFLFAALHLNPWQFFSALALGLLFGWWFWRTGSLFPCLAGHACANSLVFSPTLLPFRIQGFNDQTWTSGAVALQPWWFDGAGLALLLGGAFWFCRLTPRPAGRGAAD